MKKMFNNKKTQAGSTFALILAIIAIFVLFLIFMWAIDKINLAKLILGEGNTAVKIANSYNSLYSLQSYLSSSTEVEINGKEESITISDLIRLWNIYNDVNYKNILQSETEKNFLPFVKKGSVDVYCYYVEIENYITKTESIQLGDRHLANLNEKAAIEIPLFEDKTTTASLIINNLCLK